MARDFVGESPMARFTPSRRPGAGPGSRRDAGSGRANGTVRVVPAASSFAVADDVAIVVGGQERPGPQQEGEEDEPAQGGMGGHPGGSPTRRGRGGSHARGLSTVPVDNSGPAGRRRQPERGVTQGGGVARKVASGERIGRASTRRFVRTWRAARPAAPRLPGETVG